MVLVLVTQELNASLGKENCYCKVFKLDCSEKKKRPLKSLKGFLDGNQVKEALKFFGFATGCSHSPGSWHPITVPSSPPLLQFSCQGMPPYNTSPGANWMSDNQPAPK